MAIPSPGNDALASLLASQAKKLGPNGCVSAIVVRQTDTNYFTATVISVAPQTRPVRITICQQEKKRKEGHQSPTDAILTVANKNTASLPIFRLYNRGGAHRAWVAVDGGGHPIVGGKEQEFAII